MSINSLQKLILTAALTGFALVALGSSDFGGTIAGAVSTFAASSAQSSDEPFDDFGHGYYPASTDGPRGAFGEIE